MDRRTSTACSVEFLRELVETIVPAEGEFAPELFSGRPCSPLWFVATNPSGKGRRPTSAVVNQEPQRYLEFYLNRFEGLKLTRRQLTDSYGKELSRTVAHQLEYVNEFCKGANVPTNERWKYAMKTNKFGTHAENLNSLFKRRNILTLDESVELMIKRCEPTTVVLFGRWARDMVAAKHEVPLLKDKPDLPREARAPLVVYVPSAGYLTPSDERRNYFKTLGQQYAARRGGGAPPSRQLCA